MSTLSGNRADDITPKEQARMTAKLIGPMTRQEMQDEAGAIDTLLTAAMAMGATKNSEGAFEVIELAQTRAKRLTGALDSLYAEGGSA